MLVHLSQTQLNLLETCPPLFQQLFLDELRPPIDPDQADRSDWGSRFHQLMQQKELNLSLNNFITEDKQLLKSIEALIKAEPQIINPKKDTWREAEHKRTLQIDNYLLTAVYDLIITHKDQAQIFDWKTYLQPANPDQVRKNWQTRLYLYILAETSDYLPEQLSMTYWFVKLPTEPKKYIINYNQELHEATKKDLKLILDKLTQKLTDYLENKIDFPHIKNCETKCEYYRNFQTILTKQSTLNNNWQNMLDQIEEIAL